MITKEILLVFDVNIRSGCTNPKRQHSFPHVSKLDIPWIIYLKLLLVEASQSLKTVKPL